MLNCFSAVVSSFKGLKCYKCDSKLNKSCQQGKGLSLSDTEECPALSLFSNCVTDRTNPSVITRSCMSSFVKIIPIPAMTYCDTDLCNDGKFRVTI